MRDLSFKSCVICTAADDSRGMRAHTSFGHVAPIVAYARTKKWDCYNISCPMNMCA